MLIKLVVPIWYVYSNAERYCLQYCSFSYLNLPQLSLFGLDFYIVPIHKGVTGLDVPCGYPVPDSRD